MGRSLMWTAAALIGSFAWSVGAVEATVPEIESFNIDLGQEFASDIAPFEGGDRAVVLFVGTEPRRFALIDSVTRSVIEGSEGTFPGQVLANGGAVIGWRLYLSEWFALVSIDLDTKVITTLFEPPVGTSAPAVAPFAVSASRRRVFTIAAGHILSVDTTTDEVVVLGEVEEGYYGLAFSRDERHVYVVDFVSGLLTRFDVDRAVEPETSSYVTSSGIERTIPRVAVAPDGLIYVGYVGPEAGLPRFHISVLDPLGRLIVNTFYPFYSTGLDLTLDGRYIALGNGYFIERTSLGIVAHASTGRGGNEVRVTADGRRAYVANFNSPFATVIDLESLPLQVTVDVRSAGFPIRPNTSRSGWISVAIFSTSDFEATAVDPASVCFGSTGNPDARACVEARPVVRPTDVNHDGRMDLMLRYEAASTGIAAADRFACLTGRTYGGRSIAGCGALEAMRR